MHTSSFKNQTWPGNLQSVVQYRTMRSNVCFALSLLGLAVVQAVPLTGTEEKSVSNEATALTKDEIKLEEPGDEKDRAKKSTLCMDVHPGNKEDKAALKSEVQVAPVHTLSLVPQQSQLPPQIQTYNFQTAPQPLQAMGMMQSAQLVPQQSYVIPQPMSPPIHTLQIVHQPQPCPPQATLNIVEHMSEPVPATPQPTPEPTPAPKVETITRPPPPKPERLETMEIVPYSPPCNDMVVIPSNPIVVVPEPTLVKVPHCPHHSHQGIVCKCRSQNMGAGLGSINARVEPMSFAPMRAAPFHETYRNKITTDYHMDGKHAHMHAHAHMH